MKTTEQLAILKALKKAVDDRIKEVREISDAELLEYYNDYGAEKIALKLNGQKVGDFLITFSKEGYEITDRAALNEFLADYGLADILITPRQEYLEEVNEYLRDKYGEEALEQSIWPLKDWDKAVYFVDGECVYEDSGMVIPGLEYKPRSIKNTTVRGCDPEVVLPIVRSLGGVDQLLLGE